MEKTVVHFWTKYIKIWYHYTREQQSWGLIHIKYLPIDDIPVDELTKSLNKVKYKKFKDLIEIGLQYMKPETTTLWLL